jgi:hypothetical protein
MSSPPPYVIFQDYNAYQTAHQLPGPALQGVDLNTEFNRLKATTDALINNLGLIQRSDGALNNQSVSPDTITSSLAILIAGWAIKGPWVTLTAYALKDYVTNAGNGYVCIVAHTAGVFSTDLAAGKWALVATQGAQGIQGIQGIPGVAGASGVTRPGFVNRLINGDFTIDQRNENAAKTLTAGANVVYTVDRWYASCTGANITGQRAVGTGVNQFGYQFTGAASNLGLVFGQRIEAVNISDLLSQQVTVQVMLSSSSITTVTWKTFSANTADAWGTKSTTGTGTETQIDTGTITITPTPTLYTFQTNLGSNANRGIDLEFSCGALLGTQTLKFESIQLEFGTIANPFERQPFDTRLARCQRYYRKSYAPGTAPAAVTTIGLVGGAPTNIPGTGGTASVSFDQPMRVSPTNSYWDGAGTANKVSFTPFGGGAVWNHNGDIASVGPFNGGPTGFILCVLSGTPSGNIYLHYTADAEL